VTEPLDPETKRLRRLTPGELADEVGKLKAVIADLELGLDRHKAEGVRRGLEVADGDLFHLTLTPPGTSRRLDTRTLLAVFGDAFVNHFSRDVATDWVMRCFARPKGLSPGQAA
jgi:hypothetical protein